MISIGSENNAPASGPAVVALGGGHGLASTLQAARLYADEITAIVSLGDDGGSSGQLRSDYAVPPPGDVRRCLSALASDDSMLGAALEYRHREGVLEGHPLGNLLLTSLAIASGDFEESIAEVSQLIGSVGTIYPATTVPVTLIADADQGTISSQVKIESSTGIRNLRYQPSDPPVPDGALAAIDEADQVIVGPGSFFTSVLAAASIPKIRRALRRTEAQKVFVANISGPTGPNTTPAIAAHIGALADYDLKIDVVIVEESTDTSHLTSVELARFSLASEDCWSHDPQRLAHALSHVCSLPR